MNPVDSFEPVVFLIPAVNMSSVSPVVALAFQGWRGGGVMEFNSRYTTYRLRKFVFLFFNLNM